MKVYKPSPLCWQFSRKAKNVHLKLEICHFLWSLSAGQAKYKLWHFVKKAEMYILSYKMALCYGSEL